MDKLSEALGSQILPAVQKYAEDNLDLSLEDVQAIGDPSGLCLLLGFCIKDYDEATNPEQDPHEEIRKKPKYMRYVICEDDLKDIDGLIERMQVKLHRF